MESWMLGPPLLIGEKVFYSKNGTTVIPGTVRWLGKLPDCFGNQMVAGLALVRFLCSNTKSTVCNIMKIVCKFSSPIHCIYFRMSQFNKDVMGPSDQGRCLNVLLIMASSLNWQML